MSVQGNLLRAKEILWHHEPNDRSRKTSLDAHDIGNLNQLIDQALADLTLVQQSLNRQTFERITL